MTTLQEAIEGYTKHLKATGTSERTLYTYGKDFEQIQAYFDPERPLKSINRLQVGKFLKSDELLRLPNGKGRAPATVKKTVGVLKRFLLWAAEENMIEEAPIPKTISKAHTLVESP